MNFAKEWVAITKDWCQEGLAHISNLDLSKNYLRDDGLSELSKCIKYMPALCRLDVSSNNVTPKGIEPLCKALEKNNSLTTILLSTIDGVNRNRIGVKGGRYFSVLLGRQFSVLQSLIFNNTSLGDQGLNVMLDEVNKIIREELAERKVTNVLTT